MLINRLIFFFLLSLTFSSSPSPNHSLQHSHWTNRRRRHSDWRSLRQYKFRWLRKRYSWSICAPYMPKWTIGFIVRSRRWLLNPLGLEHGVCPPPALKNAIREKPMHSAMLPPTASSQRDWIMQSVVGINAKMGNRVLNAAKPPNVFPSLDWVHHMPSVARKSVNGEYSII